MLATLNVLLFVISVLSAIELPDERVGNLKYQRDIQKQIGGTTAEQPPILEAKKLNAVITGKNTETRNGRKVYAYLGLRYGRKPERFQIGDLPRTYNKEIDATFYGNICPQRNSTIHDKIVAAGDSDCLFLNVYTPIETPEDDDLLPVMVYFHGGGFVRGDSSIYQPTHLLDEDVLLVVINYRLGALSFFTSQSNISPGNLALHDQKLSLEWVKMYISDFGGNPDKVTIFGQGSGAVAVNYHVLSVNSQDFLAAIAQSGSALDFMGFDEKPLETSFKLAKVVPSCNETIQDIDADNIDAAVVNVFTCMSEASDDELAIAYDLLLEEYDGKGTYPFAAPSVENGEATFFPIVTQPPLESLSNSSIPKVPMIIGTVAQEGSVPFGEMYAKYLGPSGKANDDYYVQYDMVSELLKFSEIADPSRGLSRALTNEYLSYVKNIDFLSYCSGMIDMVGSLYYKSGVMETARQISLLPESSTQSIYVYSFDYQGSSTLFNFHFEHEEYKPPCPPGISRSDDLMYVFNLASEQTAQDNDVTEKMVKLWTLFATYKNPTPVEDSSWQSLSIPSWKNYEEYSPYYLSLSHQTTLYDDYAESWTITADSEVGNAMTTDESALSSESSATSTPNSRPTVEASEETTNTPGSEALQICLNEYEGLQNEYEDLQDERDAFLITMIVFILCFLAAVGACIYFFTRLH